MINPPLQQPDTRFHETYMRLALAEAEKAAAAGEVPAGCVIVRRPSGGADGAPTVIGKAHNMTESMKDPTAHAEVLAITQAAAALSDWRLTDTILYVTKEPCPMCGGAIVLARIPLIVWAVDDPKRGAQTVFNLFDHPGVNHHPACQNAILREPCLHLLQMFFKSRRG